MGKFIVRITIILTSIYMVMSYLCAQIFGIDIFSDWYVVMFELCVTIYCYSEGKYHCKHIKHLSLAIMASDIVTRLDNYFDFLSVYSHNMIPICLFSIGLLITLVKAISHFIKVRRLLHGRHNTYQESSSTFVRQIEGASND